MSNAARRADKLIRRQVRKAYSRTVCAAQANPLSGEQKTIVTIYYDFEGDYALPGKTQASLQAVERIFDIEKRYGIRSTYNTVARYAQEIPDVINALVEHGHEIASHSYDHTVLSELSPRHRRENIRAAKEVFQEMGVTITGHRSPQSAWTYGLMEDLCREGYSWAAEDGPEPYPYLFFKFHGREFWRLPVRGDDWPYESEKLTPTELFLRRRTQVNTARKTRQYTAIGFHPWIECDDSRLDAFEGFVSWLSGLSDVRVMPFGEVVGLMRSALAEPLENLNGRETGAGESVRQR